MVQENLNWSGPAENRISECLLLSYCPQYNNEVLYNPMFIKYWSYKVAIFMFHDQDQATSFQMHVPCCSNFKMI